MVGVCLKACWLDDRTDRLGRYWVCGLDYGSKLAVDSERLRYGGRGIAPKIGACRYAGDGKAVMVTLSALDGQG